MQTIFPTMCLSVSPMPTGLTPGHLSRAIKQLDTKALMSFQGTMVLVSL